MYDITDDSGFIAIIEPTNYTSFVDEDWELEQLFSHFKSEMFNGNMLIWATGESNTWRVEIHRGFTDTKGYRDVFGSIKVCNEKLYLINYESLTMAAQFSDVKLPEKHLNNLVIKLENGNYRVRVAQLYNPLTSVHICRNDIDLLIEFERSDEFENNSPQIPWSSI